MKRKRPLGIRFKLITIFIFIKVLPLIALAWVAWSGISVLGESVQEKIAKLSGDTKNVIGDVSDLAVDSSIRSLDLKSREGIERLTTDTAQAVALFLYSRDDDIRLASTMEPSSQNYRNFLDSMKRDVVDHGPWVLNEAGDAWHPADAGGDDSVAVVAKNADNAKDFHYRRPESPGIRHAKPLYLEMTFIDLEGNERIKITTSSLLSDEKKNVVDPTNTYCKAERYYPELKKLSQGDIYVSEVIGPYLKSPIIGSYTEQRALEKGIPFKPEDAAYAGKENPVGKRFQGLIRWASPVVRKNTIVGWVTLALDHTHVMEFTDHIVPTDERYSSISDAGSGNYAFMWDYKDRNISHPRDYFITGYDPETGRPAVPWMEDSIFKEYVNSGLSMAEWEETAPIFQSQSLKKKPSAKLTKAGYLGLDCRYLNFAPQCEGWHTLTHNGGSGSFVIFWSGLWKLTTAAAIPYHTGIYDGPRGFGFVTIGANVHEFHKAATETGKKISSMAADFEKTLEEQNIETRENLDQSLAKTTKEITVSTAFMVFLVILIAIWMASTLTKKITDMVKGIRSFQNGQLDYRLDIQSRDELGELAETFNEMSDDMQKLITNLRQAEENYRSFFENATEGIFRTTAEGELVHANPAFAGLFGFSSSEEMIQKVSNVGEELYVDPQRRKELVKLLQEKGIVRNFEYLVKHTDGKPRVLQTSCYWIVGNDEERYVEGISVDITERKRANEALEEAKEKAEQLSSMKSNFLSMVSHELRTPLTSILGFTKLIRKNVDHLIHSENTLVTNEYKRLHRIEKNSKVIISEGDRLAELINNVLDLAKLEAGFFEWDFVPVSVRSVVERSIASTKVLFDSKGLELESDVADDLPTISGDQDRLVQVCINLLSNAAKFTESGSVICQVRVEGLNVIVRVIDDGIGVPKDQVDVIFDKFKQLGNTLTDKPKGTGLGLPICKEIVEHHSGKLWHEPREDRGSVFAFSIPLNCAVLNEKDGTES
ncbi:ATP-binding protein [Pseudodesulfovibrio sediminis]|uniref:histidine kinase n=1 Tax=Pseudodesulfovibrio sediminis TaxID=2810563 RepID=A0ABN6EQY9_9BACT|nr:ATP-binding protein [Pseudodesulfovibrio sediminis]BCS87640.1 hypothetical protein PSDVSF_08820 [Pseudodesulfovibrio sediminis]